MPNELKRRDIDYLNNRLQGMTPVEAYQAAGFRLSGVSVPSTAIGAKERKVMQSQFVKDVATAHGLTTDVFMLKIAEGLDATLQKEYCFEGEIIQGSVRPDFRARKSYLDILGKALEITKSREDKGQDQVTNTINIMAIGDRYRDASPADLLKDMQRIKLGRTPELSTQPFFEL